MVIIWNSKTPSCKDSQKMAEFWFENPNLNMYVCVCVCVWSEVERQTLASVRKNLNKALQAMHIFHLKSTWRVWHGVV